MMDEEKIISSNHDFLVTDTTIANDIPPDALLHYLRKRRTTGDLIFRLNQGGIRQIVVSEKTKATETQREEIRKIFGMP
jgi:hypothetical protein